MNDKLLIIGGGGHAKVVADIAIGMKNPYHILGFVDDDLSIPELMGTPHLGRLDEIPKISIKYTGVKAVNAIGSNAARKKTNDRLAKEGLSYPTLIHSAATVGIRVKIGEGSVVMAKAVINPDASLGKHVIINTGAIVEHDCLIDDYAHVSPGAVCAGAAKVGAGAHIGTGAIVLPGVIVGAWATVGAGAVVNRDVEDGSTVVGVPAKPIESNKIM